MDNETKEVLYLKLIDILLDMEDKKFSIAHKNLEKLINQVEFDDIKNP